MRAKLTDSECDDRAGTCGPPTPSAEPNTGPGYGKVMFRLPLRPPATADAPRVDSVLRSSLERRGRRLWIVRTVVIDRSGRTVAVARGTGAVTASESIASLELRG